MSQGDLVPGVPDTVRVPLGLTTPPDSLLMGQPFELVGAIPHAGLRALALETPAAELEPFELAGWQRGLDRGDTAIVRMTFHAFDVGALELPPLVIRGETATGEICLARAAEVPVEVVSIVPEEASEILDIKDPVTPERPAALWPWVAAATALLLALAIVALVRARRRRGAPERVLAARPAHEAALDALAALGESPLAANGPWKSYYTELADVLRSYVARRFGVDAMDMTTREILGALEPHELAARARDELREVLGGADAVKFAKAEPAPDTPRRHLQAARRFVRATLQPRADAGAGEAAPAMGGVG